MNAESMTSSSVEPGARIRARVKFNQEIRRGTRRIILIIVILLGINYLAAVSREAGHKEGFREGKVTGEVLGRYNGFRAGYSAALEAESRPRGF